MDCAVYRDDYMLALRRLTRQRDASVFVRMMERASAFSHWLEPADWEGMHAQLKKANPDYSLEFTQASLTSC